MSRLSKPLVFLALVTLVSFAPLVFLIKAIGDELKSLETANTDNAQWTISQVNVDLAALQVAVANANVSAQSSMLNVKLRFDIYYSRVQTLANGNYSNAELTESQGAEALEQMQGFLNETVPLIDGPEDKLRAALPELQIALNDQRRIARDFSLKALEVFAAQSETRRREFVGLLVTLAAVIAVMVLALCAALVVLWYLNRLTRRNADIVQASGKRMLATIAASLDAILVSDQRGVIIEYNGAAEQVFGYSREEAVGRELAELIEPLNTRAGHNTTLQDYLNNSDQSDEGTGRIQQQARRKSGDIFPMEMSIAETAQSGEIMYVAYIRDISEQKEAQDALRKARDDALAGEKAKSEFMALMSHEMRNPLNGLIGALDLLERTPLNDKQSSYLVIMQKSSRLLLTHLNDVLDISKFNAGIVELDLYPVDLDDLLHELVDDNQPMAEARGNQLELIGPESEVGLVQADSVRLTQVLLNLVSNAIKFTRDGQVSVEYELINETFKTRTVEIRVADTGVGISDIDLERIFDDFVTLNAAYARDVGGTGLGLAIVKRIVRAMGGEVGAESVENEGSIFWVRIPFRRVSGVRALRPASSPQEKAPRALVSPLDLGGKCALAVDDSILNCQITSDMLESVGLEVDLAHTGEEAIEACKKRAYDVIFMDISMPVMDGIEATRRIRAGKEAGTLNQSTAIFALTAHALPDELAEFEAAGMTDVITKPLSFTHMDKKLRQLFPESGGDLQASLAQDPEPSGDALLDERHLKDLLTLVKADVMRQRIAALNEELQTGLEQMRLCFEGCDPGTWAEQVPSDELRDQVHKMAGMSATFGLRRLHRSLADIERALESGDCSQMGWPEQRYKALVDLSEESLQAVQERIDDFARVEGGKANSNKAYGGAGALGLPLAANSESAPHLQVVQTDKPLDLASELEGLSDGSPKNVGGGEADHEQQVPQRPSKSPAKAG